MGELTLASAVGEQLDAMLGDLGRLERLVRGPGKLPPLQLAALSVELGNVARRLKRVGQPLHASATPN